ncbi:MAG: cysteine protease StiP family protein [Planctomyces sp.]|nr:cysteine protease StiP family protein [Planctomyces sp.]
MMADSPDAIGGMSLGAEGRMNAGTGRMFSGSYDPSDVLFLLKPVTMSETSVEEKETLIQRGVRHYSEMITRESAPSEAYTRLFEAALAENQDRFAADLVKLADWMMSTRRGPLTLVSLARAGTPVGALLKRWIARADRDVVHYSVSLIRDRGIDANALKYITRQRPIESILFVDGWTGKGVMARELRHAIRVWKDSAGAALSTCPIDDRLYVVADLCGGAGYAATSDDYLIPSSLLGATVSGLVSRSIRNSDCVGPDDFDACVEYPEFRSIDRSRAFLDQIEQRMCEVSGTCHEEREDREFRDMEIQERRQVVLKELMERLEIHNENYIKPGIGEATRVLLRRVPWRLIVRNSSGRDIQHLLELAESRGVPVEELADLPWQAVSIIRSLE